MKQALIIIAFLLAATGPLYARQKHSKPVKQKPQPKDTLKIAPNIVKPGGDSTRYKMPVIKPDSMQDNRMPVVKPDEHIQPK